MKMNLHKIRTFFFFFTKHYKKACTFYSVENVYIIFHKRGHDDPIQSQ